MTDSTAGLHMPPNGAERGECAAGAPCAGSSGVAYLLWDGGRLNLRERARRADDLLHHI